MIQEVLLILSFAMLFFLPFVLIVILRATHVKSFIRIIWIIILITLLFSFFQFPSLPVYIPFLVFLFILLIFKYLYKDIELIERKSQLKQERLKRKKEENEKEVPYNDDKDILMIFGFIGSLFVVIISISWIYHLFTN